MKRRVLLPSFLQQLDHYLLVHLPDVWATRIVPASFWGMIWIGLLAFSAAILPLEASHVPNLTEWWWGIMVISWVPLLIWVISALRQVPTHQFSRHTFRRSIFTAAALLLGVGIFSAPSWFFTKVLDIRIRGLLSEERLIEDVNALNLGAVFLRKQEQRGDTHNLFTPVYYLSIVQNPSQLWGEKELEQAYLRLGKNTEKELAAIRHAIETSVKYGNTIHFSAEEVLRQFYANEPVGNPTYPAQKNIYAIHQSHIAHIEATSPLGGEFLGYYLVGNLFIFLLILLLVYTGWKSFLLSILLSYGLGIFSGIFIGFTSHILGEREETYALILLLFWGGLFWSGFKKWKIPIILQTMVLSIAMAPLPFFFLLVGQVVFEIDHFTFPFLFLGFSLTFLVWFWIIEKRLKELYAQPKEE